MYFNEKEDTNIDNQFDNGKKINFDFKKIKPILFIVVGIILLIIIISVIVSLTKNSNKYTIELYGEEKITLTLGSDYAEPGYIAYDKNNNDVTNEVEITSNIDTSKKGEYEILYSVGNVNKVRYITIIDSVDETIIRLNGDVNMYLEVGEKYTEPGYKVYDSIDKNLTEKVTVSGSVNVNKIGTYQLTYSVTNSRGITVAKKRTITVVAKGQKP